MLKRLLLIMLAAFNIFLLSGCWDYSDLDEMSVVAGVAVDRSEKEDFNYTVSFEIVRTSAASEEMSQRSSLIKADGKTIYEAIDRAQKLLVGSLYFGNTEVVVISEELAFEEGVKSIMESFYRDLEIRDIVIMAVSREDTARAIITPPEGSDGMILSYKLFESVSRSRPTTHSTRVTPFYRIYNELERDTESLALPAFFFEKDGAEPRPVSGGLAVFDGDTLTGYLDEAALPYYLFITENLDGGIFSYYLDEDPKKSVTLSIYESNPKMDYSYDNGKLTLKVALEVRAGIREFGVYTEKYGSGVPGEMEAQSSEKLGEILEGLINLAQKDLKHDIFGFGSRIYKNNPALWREISSEYRELFCGADIEVFVNFSIYDTGMIKNY